MATSSLRLIPIVAGATAYVAADRLVSLVAGDSPERALGWMQRWSRSTCRRLGLSVTISGEPSNEPCVYVANHRSYLDIAVLSNALGTTFLSRDDISDWAVIGPGARAIGAVFVDRGDTWGRATAARRLWRHARDTSVIVFPEGTTCGEPMPSPFQPGLFRLLHRMGATVKPVTIRYGSRDAYWVEDLSVGEHLRDRVIAANGIRCSVHIGESVPPTESPEALASAVYAAVCRPIAEHGELVHGE